MELNSRQCIVQVQGVAVLRILSQPYLCENDAKRPLPHVGGGVELVAGVTDPG